MACAMSVCVCVGDGKLDDTDCWTVSEGNDMHRPPTSLSLSLCERLFMCVCIRVCVSNKRESRCGLQTMQEIEFVLFFTYCIEL